MKNNFNLETCLLFHKVPVFKTSVSGFEEKFTKQIFAHRLQLSNGGENISLKENSDCLKLLGDESNFSNTAFKRKIDQSIHVFHTINVKLGNFPARQNVPEAQKNETG